MEVKFSSGVLQEVKEITDYYESEIEGLGRAYLSELRKSISLIKKYPHASRVIKKDFRRHLLSRFPYGIIYQLHGEIIFISAVMHLKRKPGYWEER